MSVNCTKDFSVTIGEEILLAYWNLDEADGIGTASRIDSVDSVALAVVSPQVLSVAAKISNGIRMITTNNIVSGKLMLTSDRTEYAYNGQGITLACWARIEDDDTDNQEQLLFSYEMVSTVGGGLVGGFSLCYNPFLNDFLVRIENGGGTTLRRANAALVTGTWYLVQGIYHDATGLPSIKVDNNATVDGIVSRTLPDSGAGRFKVQQFPCDVSLELRVDEAGAWLTELSAAQLSQLWNSGNGNTYPNVPQ